MQEKDEVYKIQVVGSPGSGKKSLILRYADNTYTDAFISTMGVNFKTVRSKVPKVEVKNLIFDYNQTKRLQKVPAYIITVDMTDPNALKTFYQNLMLIRQHGSYEPIIAVAATKCDDVENQKIRREELADYVESCDPNISIEFVSAKNNDGVDKLFAAVNEQLVEKQDELNFNNLKDLAVKGLVQDLDKYIKRIEGTSANSKPDYSAGFWIMAQSRALNREANYLLAKEMKKQLLSGSSVAEVFGNVNELRAFIVTNHRIYERDGYVKRPINSAELNSIIDKAQEEIEKNLVRRA